MRLVRQARHVSLLLSLTLASLFGCGTSGPALDLGPGSTVAPVSDDASSSFSTSPSSSDDGGGVFSGAGGTPVPACQGGRGWSCAVNASCGSSPTTLTGKVYDPAGKNPLSNVVVFVPNDAAKLPEITPGTHSCNTCDVSIGGYVAATTTDATGSFTLKNVPHGEGCAGRRSDRQVAACRRGRHEGLCHGGRPER